MIERTHTTMALVLALGPLALIGCDSILAPRTDEPPGSPVPSVNNETPVAVGGEPFSVGAGDRTLFDAGESFDPDGDIVAYRWEFGDGEMSNDPTVEHTFDIPGEFTVTLVVTDNGGASGTASFVVTVTGPDGSGARIFALNMLVDPPESGTIGLDPPGGVYDEGTVVTLQAVASEGFAFLGFAGDAAGTATTTEVLMNDNKSVIAEFLPVGVTLTVVVEPIGTGAVTLDPPGGTYDEGTVVALSAVASEGYAFLGFAGDVAGTAATTEVLMNGDKSVIAEFSPIQVAVVVGVEPIGTGTVALDPPGSVYDYGTSVTITASADPGFSFDAFVDDAGTRLTSQPEYTFIATSDIQVVARFLPTAPTPTPSFTLSVQVIPDDGGTVTVDPPGESHTQGTLVTLTAVPAAGYIFVGYSGDVADTLPSTSFTMDAGKNVVAQFAWSPATGNPGNLLVTGFTGKNVTEFDRFNGNTLGKFISESSSGLSVAGGIDFGPNGNLFVVNVGFASTTSVMQYDGATGAFFGPFVTGPGLVGFLALRFGPSGSLYVPDSSTDSIGEYSGTTGELLRTFVSAGSGGLDNPVGLVFGPSGNALVVSQNTNAIIEYNGTTGQPVRTVVDFSTIGLSVPVDLAFGPDGALYVSLSGDESVARIDLATGDATPFVASRAGGLDSPAGVAFHPDAGLLVVSQGTNEVLEYDKDSGAFLGAFATGDAGDSIFFITFRHR